MNRCKRCVLPDTRPDSHFVDGICSACREYDLRETIDWDKRRDALTNLIYEARNRHAPYDCVVPVSGGKDSTYQVLTLQREFGAHVLAVNGATDLLSPLGRQNLDNLKRFVDVIEVTPNIDVRNRLIRMGLEFVGDLSYPEHLIIWAAPTRIAVAMKIPLVIWGEQPQREYAAPNAVPIPTNLDARWVAEFGGLLGLRVADCIGINGITSKDMEPYCFPNDDEMRAAGVRGIWLGDYVPWDGWKNAFIAQQFGWQTMQSPVEQSLANYENLDNFLTVLRDWLRFCKYGYARATDIASNHVRRGRLTRDEALMLIAEREQPPQSSLGVPLDDILQRVGLTSEEYWSECLKWRNARDADNSRSTA